VFDFGRGAPGFHELRLPTRAVVDEFCRYTPPELLSDVVLDARSDVYAFGLLLYEAITGERIFVADDLFDLLREIEAGPKRAIADVTQAMPRGLVEVLYRAIALDPKDRYQELASFLAALLPFASRTGKVTESAYTRTVKTNVTTDQPASSRSPWLSANEPLRVPRRWSAAVLGTFFAASYVAIDHRTNELSQTDKSFAPVTPAHAAVHAQPEGTRQQQVPEPRHDLIISEPVLVIDPARVVDARTHVSSAPGAAPRRSRGRSERQRERAVAPDTAAVEPNEPAVAPAQGATSSTPLERMQLQ
jgi:serine/threonine protein kinase